MKDLLQVLVALARFSRRIPHARWKLLVIMAAGVASGVAHVGLIALINAALARRGFSAAALGWPFAALCVGLAGFGFVSEALLVRLVQKTLFDLRLGLCRSILSAPLRHLETLGPARLLATLSNDVAALADALGSIPFLCAHLAMVAGCLVYLGWLSPVVLAALLAFMAAGIVSYQLPITRGIRYRRLARDESDALFEHLRGLTEGTKELKMHAPRRHAFLTRQLEATSANLQRNDGIALTIFAAASAWGRVLFFAAIGLVLFVLPRLMPLSGAVVLGYCITLIQMMTPLDGILNALPRLSGASVAARKIEHLGLALADGPQERPADVRPPPPAPWRRLDLVGVTHSYHREGEENAFILGPIDLALEQGELVFLIGGNGSGKTTLAKLLLGLYRPESGDILLDGDAVEGQAGDAYRQLFSPVFADFFVFQQLVGVEASQDERAREYLERLQLGSRVRIAAGALSTTELSQGQRKRLALLTAYLDDRPIYLFDEWAADQDPFFKEVFYRQLLPELKARGKTVFVISHDDRYFDVADRVIKLANGRVESDTRTGATLTRPEPAAPPALEETRRESGTHHAPVPYAAQEIR